MKTTMRVKREDFLRGLEMVSPALQSNDSTQQSTCLLFTKGWVITFNGEMSCSYNIGVPKEVELCVQGKKIITILGLMSEDEIDLEFTDKVLYIDGKGKTTEIYVEDQVLMPIEALEPPSAWQKLPEKFHEAVNLVKVCCDDNDKLFDYTCIHLHPDWIEACSRFRSARYTLDTGMPESVLVQKKDLVSLIGFGMTEMSFTNHWVHFRNPSGLIISVRHLPDDNYKDVGQTFNFTGERVRIPKSIKETAKRAEVFVSEWDSKEKRSFVTIHIEDDLMTVVGKGYTAKQIEDKRVKYQGPPLSFGIPVDMLVDIIDRGTEFIIGKGRMKVDRGEFMYASGLEEISNGKKK